LEAVCVWVEVFDPGKWSGSEVRSRCACPQLRLAAILAVTVDNERLGQELGQEASTEDGGGARSCAVLSWSMCRRILVTSCGSRMKARIRI